MTWSKSFCRASMAVGVLGITLGFGAAAESRASAAEAAELATLMTARQLDVFAAQDPEAADRFVAAMIIPNVQMLIVAAQYPTPADLQAQLAAKNFRDVYAALHQPVAQPTRVFFIDLAIDGLRPSREAVDVFYEKGTTQVLLNGNWKDQGLSESAYNEKVRQAGEQYTRLVRLLAGALKAP